MGHLSLVRGEPRVQAQQRGDALRDLHVISEALPVAPRTMDEADRPIEAHQQRHRRQLRCREGALGQIGVAKGVAQGVVTLTSIGTDVRGLLPTWNWFSLCFLPLGMHVRPEVRPYSPHHVPR